MIENDIMKTLKQLHALVISFMQWRGKAFVQNTDQKTKYMNKLSTHRWIDFLRAIGGDIRVL